MPVQKSLEHYWMHHVSETNIIQKITESIYRPFLRAGCDTRLIFLLSLNSVFFFFFSETGCHTKAKESSLPNYYTLARKSVVGFMPFEKVLALY